MKAISLTQPWASMCGIMEGMRLKGIETRSWHTNYRGPLAIHASKGWDFSAKKLWQDIQAQYPVLKGYELPFGSVIAIVNLTGCVKTERVREACLAMPFDPPMGWDVEMQFGNYGPRRYAWLFDFVEMVEPPIPCKGALQLWEWKQITKET